MYSGRSRCFEVETFNVSTSVVCIVSADDRVPKELVGGHICHLRGQFSGILDEIAPNCDLDAVGVIFLQSKINNNSGIHHNKVFRNGAYLVMCEKSHCVCTFFVYPPPSE